MDNNTAMHIAASYNRTKMCDLLTFEDINIDQQNIKGETALYIAASKGYMGVC